MANFNFYLNRQGVRGPQGEKGDPGFSPSISIKSDTPSEFIMTINNESDSFDTPNLIPQSLTEAVDNLSNTVVQHTTELVNLENELDSAEARLNAHTDDLERLNSETQTNSTAITGKQNKLKAGDNITLTDNSDGTTTIASEGGTSLPDNVAYTDKGNTFHSTQKILNSHYSTTGLVVGQHSADNTDYVTGDPSISITGSEISFGGLYPDGGTPTIRIQQSDLPLKFFTNGLRVRNSAVLTTSSIKAGENISVSSDDNTGEVIISSSGGGAKIDDVTISTTTVYSSDKTVNTITDLVSNAMDTLDTKKQDKLVAGSNITLVPNSDGTVTISSSGGGGGGSTVDVPIATTTVAGKVKPDGTTITITEDGTISTVPQEVTPTVPDNMVTTDTEQYITGEKIFTNADGISIGSGQYTGLKSGEFKLGTSTGNSGMTITTTFNKSDYRQDTFIRANSYLTIKNGNNAPITISPYADNLHSLKYQSGYTSSRPVHTILHTGNIKAGDGIAITTNDESDDTVTISATGGGSSAVASNNGIQGDYATHYGIVDCPNGIVDFGVNKDITINQGLVLKCAGNGLAKTTISSPITYTLTSTGLITLFYADGNLLECGKVDYSETIPEDNGVENYQAWFNPDKTANPNQQWQFKSNDTGNVFRYVNSATPIADININATNVVSVSYIGYRVIDDDIFAQLSDVESIQNDIEGLTNTVNSIDTESFVNINATNVQQGGVIRVAPDSANKKLIISSDAGSIANMAMPSYNKTNLTLGASNTQYTMPHAGYLRVQKEVKPNGELAILGGAASSRISNAATSNQTLVMFAPVQKGQTVTVRYNLPSDSAGVYDSISVYYLVGNQPAS